MNEYPKQITFESCNSEGFTSDAQKWLNRIKAEVKIIMTSCNSIQIDYPEELIEKVQPVCVDDMIYRLDLIDPGKRFFMCNSIFPDVPWNNREFMQKRWASGTYSEQKGRLTITYP